MRNVSKLLMVLTLVASVVLLACSKSTDNDRTEGDPNDQDFQMAQGLLEGLVDSTLSAAMAGAGYLNFDGSGPLRVTEDTAYVVFDEATCWWEVYISYSDTTGFSYIFVDSVKFQDSEGCQQFPDSNTTNEIEYRAYADVGIIADSGSISAVLNENMLITGIQGDYVVINSSATGDMDMIYGQVSYAVDYSGTVVDLRFLRDDLVGGGQAYPLSGVMMIGMSVNTVGPNGSYSVSWTADITFYEDHYHVYAVSGDNYWEWDVYYPQPT